MRKHFILAISFICLIVGSVASYAETDYQHDRFVTKPQDIVRNFDAFMVSFDSEDDNDGDGKEDIWGIPEFVAYEVRRYAGKCIPTVERPKWFSDDELVAKGIAPTDKSYAYSAAWVQSHPDWYERGHLCMKLIAERISNDAGYNTHILLNAVPQRKNFNKGIWQDLELLSAAYAQKYGKVWVVTGPVFYDKKAKEWIGETSKNELPVAAPDALFKVIIKEGKDDDKPDVLAFIYKQQGAGYDKKPFNHSSHLVSIDEIEKLTGLDFFTSLSEDNQKYIETTAAKGLWPVDKVDFIPACKRN